MIILIRGCFWRASSFRPMGWCPPNILDVRWKDSGVDSSWGKRIASKEANTSAHLSETCCDVEHWAGHRTPLTVSISSLLFHCLSRLPPWISLHVVDEQMPAWWRPTDITQMACSLGEGTCIWCPTVEDSTAPAQPAPQPAPPSVRSWRSCCRTWCAPRESWLRAWWYNCCCYLHWRNGWNSCCR